MNGNNIKINPQVIRDKLDELGISQSDMSQQLYHSVSYIAGVIKRGAMDPTTLALFCTLYDVPRKDLVYTEPEPAPVPSGKGSSPYTIDLDIRSDKLAMTLSFNGAPIYIGRCKIRGPEELDLMQSISYAAHMIYKLCEQDVLEKKMK